MHSFEKSNRVNKKTAALIKKINAAVFYINTRDTGYRPDKRCL